MFNVMVAEKNLKDIDGILGLLVKPYSNVKVIVIVIKLITGYLTRVIQNITRFLFF